MKLLFIDACQRGPKLSRTHRICRAFLEELEKVHPHIWVETVCLREEKLHAFDEKAVEKRSLLVDQGKLEDPMFRWADAFNEADFFLIGAPYWDLSFPAALKTYVENIFVHKINFECGDQGKLIGLANGQKTVYITTSGGYIGEDDWGAGYMRAVMRTLGIPKFQRISAEGLDIEGNDIEAILLQAEEEARCAARRMPMD